MWSSGARRVPRPAGRVRKPRGATSQGTSTSVESGRVKPRLVGINHVALQVDDLEEAGVQILPGQRVDFRDPSGNRVQVQYDQIQFIKADQVVHRMGLKGEKTEAALYELRAKGLAE